MTMAPILRVFVACSVVLHSGQALRRGSGPWDLSPVHASGAVPRDVSFELPDRSLGIFTGLKIDKSFPNASFWGRQGSVVTVEHGVDGKLSFGAQYSDSTGVSDLVYYRVRPDHFCVGCGRGTGWKNDEQLEAEYAGLGTTYYATRADYAGVGYFKIDRGHQAPVASFNTEEVEADLTNMPTNLSPQTAKLNQGSWVQIEIDIRDKARKYSADEEDDGTPLADLEVITGPLYQLPDAMVHAPAAQEAWNELLVTGASVYDAKKNKTKVTTVPFCAKPGEDPKTFTDDIDKKPSMKCHVEGAPTTADPRADPNSLQIEFNAGKRGSTDLRVPLGYFKMFTIPSGTRFGRRTCAFVMDQVGQCLITSVEMLSKIAHLDLSQTLFAEKAGGLDGWSHKDAEYTSYVNPFWCNPPGGVLRRRAACLHVSRSSDPGDITEAMIEKYWERMKAAEKQD
eukprot:TRINITY_DN30034_c0_g3_i1.p1 TRINITY_DN30034_c0_g3~~TRINITY_DN30034_c0_g3_i1.p1  ORF type:complete len:452 (-),score=67.50 TRINITY_DN30034_c0_g3_i1:72-1427(-)